jgi:GNAT superfamily N-acetyltransferase
MKTLLTLGAEDVPDVTRVLCEAFYDYPVMRYVVGDSHGDYERRQRTLVHFFVTARVLRDEVILGVMDGGAGSEDRSGVVGGGNLSATALVSYPGPGGNPEELATLRDGVWSDLGPESRSRYEAFSAACAPFEVNVPHIHLNMIGVTRAAQGSGLGRDLIEHVHFLSEENGASQGVTLTTEDPSNVALYEHFGYEVVGHSRVSSGLETWGFFRPDQDR